MTNIAAFRNKIRQMIFDDIVERSEASINILKKHAKDNEAMAKNAAEMEEAGSLPVDFGKLADFIVQLCEENDQGIYKDMAHIIWTKSFRSSQYI